MNHRKGGERRKRGHCSLTQHKMKVRDEEEMQGGQSKKTDRQIGEF